jgi:VWFA-related protein
MTTNGLFSRRVVAAMIVAAVVPVASVLAAPGLAAPAAENTMDIARPGDRSATERLLEKAARGEPLTDAELEQILAGTTHEEVRVSMIMVPVLAVDRRGRPIPGLVAKDFAVRVEGRPQPITWFSEEMNRPFRMAVLLDVSESMSLDDIRARLEQTLTPIAREVGLVDRMMLLSFSDQGVQKRSGWSDRPMALVREALQVPSHGKTAIVDALAAAAREFPPSPKDRQAIVLITDGLDNASELTVQDAVAAARDVNVPVYAILLGGQDRQIQSRRFTGSPLKGLQEIAEESGGRAFLVDGVEAAENAAAQIRDDLRHQYWLSFRPSPPPDGRFHPIQVEVKKWGASVRTRAGYR